VEWVTLALWVLVLFVALPLGVGLLNGRISLGLQAMAAGTGLALIIVYLIVDDPVALAWVASGVAFVGLLATLAGAVNLMSDREDGIPATATAVDELEAGLAGVQLPLFGVTLVLTVLLALEVGTPT
jgi:hypothetical protein